MSKSNKNYVDIILPRTGKKPIEFNGCSVYRNTTRNNKFITIYETSPEIITTRYLLEYAWSHGGHDWQYHAFPFDDALELMKYIRNDCEIDFTFTASDLLKISQALDCCETEQLI